jgi:hypothetical protein
MALLGWQNAMFGSFAELAEITVVLDYGDVVRFGEGFGGSFCVLLQTARLEYFFKSNCSYLLGG